MTPINVILHTFMRTLEVLADADRESQAAGNGWLPHQNKGQFCALVRGAIQAAEQPGSGADPEVIKLVKYMYNRYAGSTYKESAWDDILKG